MNWQNVMRVVVKLTCTYVFTDLVPGFIISWVSTSVHVMCTMLYSDVHVHCMFTYYLWLILLKHHRQLKASADEHCSAIVVNLHVVWFAIEVCPSRLYVEFECERMLRIVVCCTSQDSRLPHNDQLRAVRQFIKHLHFFTNSSPAVVVPSAYNSPVTSALSTWNDFKRCAHSAHVFSLLIRIQSKYTYMFGD